jgi:peptidoglycan/LPS O-acetylase OafA/YrhL
LTYRPEIDGLRALAVIPVILFHAGFELFSGGFVGVDVFFVISGYLITTILIQDLNSQKFSFISFYERRARRILPALFFVMLVCIPFAWLWMLPSQMKDFSQSLVATSLFASNILFWRESGYFAAASEEKPLLHTWSLAVEEQYYLLFPLFFFLAWRFEKNRVLWIVVIIAVMSFLLSEWGWRNQPIANFYLAPTRAWELLSGSIAAFILQQSTLRKNNLYALIGLIAILLSIFIYDHNTPVPSIYALAPVLGTMLVVLFADQKTIVGRLLGTRAIVAIGLISYSAYLWHQPLFAFAKLRLDESPTSSLMIALSFASFVLAYLTWRYIETPFRSSNKHSLLKLRTIYFLGSITFILIGTLFIFFDKQIRYSESQATIIADGEKNHEIMKSFAYDRSRCFFDYTQDANQLISNECIKNSMKSRIIIFGDSEAAHLQYGFTKLFPNHDVMQFTGTSCRAIDYEKNTHRCKKFFHLFMRDILPKISSTDLVVISSNWWGTYRKIGEQEFSLALTKTLTSLKTTGAKVHIFTNTPGFLKNPYEQTAVEKISEYANDIFLPSQSIWKSDQSIKEIATSLNVAYFDVSQYLCDEKRMCLFKDSRDYLFFDKGHLSFYGSEFVAEKYRNSLMQ